ncbi:MAG: DEAD/DEAH box helicase [Planctomycetes bacterium]|nr:DEAD/DEAH box helicase [Planctomycetota bacterium]
MSQTEKSQVTFNDLGVSPIILNVLQKLKIETPTPIQKKSIPIALQGEDLIGIAQTGTGKTFAFGIPMLQKLAVEAGQGLIILPTRELALQVEENLKKISPSLNLRTAVLIGGQSMDKQLYQLRRNPHIIIATPGRLIDHLKRRLVKLNEVKMLVLDEADMMFDMGFAPQVEVILADIKQKHQTLLFSATMPAAIAKLAAKHMNLPVSIEVAPSGTTAEKVEQEVYVVRKEEKIKHLTDILEQYQGSVLVFTRTKYGAKALTQTIQKIGQTSAEIHSNRSLSQRREALAGFKSKKYRVLVATDIAARGIDVTGIELVVNYDLPESSEDYVHRIGRTGRAGNVGRAISFATPDQWREIRSIERLINKTLTMKKFAEMNQPIERSRRVGGNFRKDNFRNNNFRSNGPRNNVSSFKRDDFKKIPFTKNNFKKDNFQKSSPSESFGFKESGFKNKFNNKFKSQSNDKFGNKSNNRLESKFQTKSSTRSRSIADDYAQDLFPSERRKPSTHPNNKTFFSSSSNKVTDRNSKNKPFKFASRDSKFKRRPSTNSKY